MSHARICIVKFALVAWFTGHAVALQYHNVVVDGDTPGWETRAGDAWYVEDDTLICPGGEGGWFGSTRSYTDFIIELEFQVRPGGNSGVFLRYPGEGRASARGLEVQILDDYAARHADLQAGQYCGSLYKFGPPARRVSRPAGYWNTMRITADRDHIRVELNGHTIVDADGQTHPEIRERSTRGAIGLQNYGNEVRFRNLRIADLAEDRMQRTEWWREARFGMFIHWGVYAEIGHGEWVMKREKIPAAEYEKLPPKFNPVKFDAAEWVALAKRAGQKYIVITSKHHDGFAMFDTVVSEYDIIDATPFDRDPLKELADACREQGVRLGLYHSILDWHHRDYTPVPEWDVEARAKHEPVFDHYLAFMRNQVRELCTDYGPLACIWWDGGWDHKTPDDIRRFREINAMIRELQPDILINNRANTPEDFATPEQYIPPTGLHNPDGSPKLWENCITLTTGHGSHQPTAWWGYDRNETEYKTPEFCIRMLIDVVSKGGNLLLNVGPTPEGEIQPVEVEVLEAMGKWLNVNGEAIYGTTASPFRHLPFFGKATVKRNKLYLHVFEWPIAPPRQIVLPGLQNQVRKAYLLADPRVSLQTQRRASDVVVHLTDRIPGGPAAVVALELDGPPEVEPFTIKPDDAGAITLPVLLGDIRGRHGQRARYESSGGIVHLGNWVNKNDFAAWQFDAGKGGTFKVSMTYAADKTSADAKFELAAGPAAGAKANVGGGNVVDISAGGIFDVAPDAPKLEGTVKPTGDADTFAAHNVGTITLPEGMNVLTVRATSIPEAAELMKLRQVKLTPNSPSP